MEDYILELNEKQREAVLDTEGYVLVFAGAGSGKTKVLTTRVTHLVKGKGVDPENILAITFTNKAADEMKERLSSMVEGVSRMWVCTIHSMCVKILRSSIGRLEGYDRNFSIYSEIDKANVLKRIIADMKIEDEKYLKNSKFYISDCKNKDISPSEFKLRTDVRDITTYAKIYYEYEQALKKSNALDFDDLLVKTYHLLLEDEEVLEYYAGRFRYVHIDEFQDTNTIQLEIAKLLSSTHKNLFAVGDDDQSIYGWRGAEIRNILEFEKNFRGAKIHKLEQNYRSTKRILKLANAIIASNSERKPKALWTDNCDGEKVQVKIANDENEEASYTAFQIKRLLNEGAAASDFAVLMRINALSRAYEQEFTKYGIPYKVFGGFKFFERKEIKDLTAYFRILTNPLDNESLLRIINVPKRGIGDKTVEVLLDYAKQYDLSVFDGIVDAEQLPLSQAVKNKLNDFRKMINSLTVECATKNLTDIFASVIEKTGFLTQFDANTEENYGKRMNVNEYQNSIEEFAKLNKDATLSDYLNSITLSSDTDELEEGNFVTIATIHSVKGLEFPNVFICGLDENVFPVSRATDGQGEMEEERRLMYVAITRAEKRLFLTRANSRFLYGTRQFTMASCFLQELAPELGIAKPKPSYRSSDSEYYQNSYGYGQRQRQYGQSTSYGGYGYNQGYGQGYNQGYSSKRDAYQPDTYEREPDYGYGQSSGGGFSSKGLSSFGVKKPAETSAKNFSEYKAGIKVHHQKFGDGTIITTRGEGKNLVADIAFPGVGIKSIAVQYAPIEIIKK